MRASALIGSIVLLTWATFTTADAGAVVQVMVVGTYHMSNPHHDMHDVQSDDVLAPGRQAEIAGIVNGIARFRPTVVDVEWPRDVADKRYAAYLSGALAPSRDESVQLGFRLAKQMGLPRVNGIDVDGDFPYEPVENYAKAHGKMPLLQAADDRIAAEVAHYNGLLAHGSIADVLRAMNEPESASRDNDFYRTTLKIGDNANQPGADLLAAWYKRNFYICANLVQKTSPGDRVVVFYGSGHLFLLRQCVSETPGFRLVEANAWLPR
ncbi:MAG TPA: DUF5694 domain-containing protein [Rhizomicrobium sp.]|nr:DUF5694 domain-containing protein [Rhizomicrobium sp.]